MLIYQRVCGRTVFTARDLEEWILKYMETLLNSRQDLNFAVVNELLTALRNNKLRACVAITPSDDAEAITADRMNQFLAHDHDIVRLRELFFGIPVLLGETNIPEMARGRGRRVVCGGSLAGCAGPCWPAMSASLADAASLPRAARRRCWLRRALKRIPSHGLGSRAVRSPKTQSRPGPPARRRALLPGRVDPTRIRNRMLGPA
jgi:hypothetical protein